MLNRTETFLDSQSMASSFNSSPLMVADARSYSIDATFTGSPSGVLELQASIDGQTWARIYGSNTTITTADTIIWNVYGPGYVFVRLLYTRTGGSGSLTAKLFMKGNR
jgi:hypothetical protein